MALPLSIIGNNNDMKQYQADASQKEKWWQIW
jgi:hypothetical protein